MGFDPWVRNIPWRRKRLPTPVFLPGESHGQRSLVGYSLWGRKRVGHNLATKQQQCQQFVIILTSPSVLLPLPTPHACISILSVFVSIPALQIGHLYHFSRFHIHALINNICSVNEWMNEASAHNACAGSRRLVLKGDSHHVSSFLPWAPGLSL